MAAMMPRTGGQVLQDRKITRAARWGRPFAATTFGRSVLLDLLEHLEDALGGADEHALEGLGQATTLERVAAGAGTVGPVRVFSNCFWGATGRGPTKSFPQKAAREKLILYTDLDFYPRYGAQHIRPA